MLGNLLLAVRTLTIVPAPQRGGTPGGATLFFPAVGLLLGLLVACAAGLVSLPPPLPALLAIALLAILGGGRSLRGLAHLGDAVVAGRDRERALALLQRARVGAAGAVAVATVIAVKAYALAGAAPFWSLVFAPMLGRWAMVVVAFSARLARVGAPGPRFEPGITFQEFGWASVIAGGVALVAIDAVGLVAMLAVAATTVGVRLMAHRWLGGIDQSVFWASAELGEIAALLMLSAFALR